MDQTTQSIHQLIKELRDKITILGHHYQRDEVIQFADVTGDSLQLAQKAAALDHPYIIFCGVHFMAETANMVARSSQKVFLPDPLAGCSMADMADIREVERAWSELKLALSNNQRIIPITYINSTAAIKAFVGRNNGFVCTSSNAAKIITRALELGDLIFFLPDQHLGRNCAFRLGIPLTQMELYSPLTGLTAQQKQRLPHQRVVLWDGNCCVHQEFFPEHIRDLRASAPGTKIVVHPECCFEVCQAADAIGSTSQIVQMIEHAPKGSSWAIGTETRLVTRLQRLHPDKQIRSLAPNPVQALCRTMSMITAAKLEQSLQMIKRGDWSQEVVVDEQTKRDGLVALKRMLELS